MNTIDRITTDEIIRLFSPAITSHEERTGMKFQDYDTDFIWTGKDGRARRGIFVFLKEHGTARHFTAEYLLKQYGV